MIRMAMELSILLFNSLDNVGTEPLAILLWIKQESAANKVWGVECRELRRLGLIFYSGRWGRILTAWIKWHLSDRIMPQLHNGWQLPTKRINSQVLLPRLGGWADGRTEEDLLGIIHKHLEGHCMSNMFSKANKVTMAFLGLGWKSSRPPMPEINRLPKLEV